MAGVDGKDLFAYSDAERDLGSNRMIEGDLEKK